MITYQPEESLYCVRASYTVAEDGTSVSVLNTANVVRLDDRRRGRGEGKGEGAMTRRANAGPLAICLRRRGCTRFSMKEIGIH